MKVRRIYDQPAAENKTRPSGKYAPRVDNPKWSTVGWHRRVALPRG